MHFAGFLSQPLFPAAFYIDRTPEIIGLYLLYLLAGTIERLTSTFSKKRFDDPQPKISEVWFLVSFYGYIALILLSVIEFFARVRVINAGLSISGFLIYGFGVVLRRRAIADLGKSWDVTTTAKPDCELVTSGVYRFMKHPYYLAVICELIGASLVANAVYTALLVLMVQCPLLTMRIGREEKQLSAIYGAKYENYSKGKIL